MKFTPAITSSPPESMPASTNTMPAGCRTRYEHVRYDARRMHVIDSEIRRTSALMRNSAWTLIVKKRLQAESLEPGA